MIYLYKLVVGLVIAIGLSLLIACIGKSMNRWKATELVTDLKIGLFVITTLTAALSILALIIKSFIEVFK